MISQDSQHDLRPASGISSFLQAQDHNNSYKKQLFHTEQYSKIGEELCVELIMEDSHWEERLHHGRPKALYWSENLFQELN